MENNFEYSYCAESHREIEQIRKKYITEDESTYEGKLAQLKALDRSVEKKGLTASLAVGIVGILVLGTGMSCTMVWADRFFFLGIVLGLAGIIGVCAAYPLYRRITEKERKRIAPMILKLSDELEKMSSR